MKVRIIIPLLMSLGFLFSCSLGQQNKNSDISWESLESGFKQTPDSLKFAVYWYWISDNISKEGVVKDLKAMKHAGINRAFIGNIGIDGLPKGKVKFFSDEWWEIMHTALKTATELGIEIGIFNSPGWSQSGGPWVKPEQSMRYLASESIELSGGNKNPIKLPAIEGGQDVKVIAYPIIPERSKEWTIKKRAGQTFNLMMQWDKSDTNPKTLILKTFSRIKTPAQLFANVGGEFKLLKSFEFNRTNPKINVGFDPYAPVVISIPSTDATQLKLVLGKSGDGEINVSLTTKPYIERYPEKSLAKMFQTPLPMWHDYMWPDQDEPDFGIIRKEDIIDLTSKVNDKGELEWNVPSGNWRIVKYAMKTTGEKNSPATPEATGLEIDKMSKKHIASHFDAFLGEIMRRIPEADRKCFKVAVMDSYETGGLNWTDDMEKRFVEVYGYSPVPFLPVLYGEIVQSADASNRFLWDLRRLIADRVSYDYVGGLREVCHANGLTTWLENYGHWGFPGEFLQYGGQSDEVAGEYWSEGSLGDIENRAASSCAHIYGKRKVWAESFTAGKKSYARYPYVMKQRGDRFFTEGINSTLLHLYIQQPDDVAPGVNAWFGNEFNRNNTWFSQIDVFIQYLKRCNWMLQQGSYIADVAYFIGEDAPKMTGVQDPELPKGYSFDYINSEVLMKYASVQDGCLVLESGMKYRVLVLPKQETMRPELLDKICDFVDKGLVILGPAPLRSPSLCGYPEADKKIKSLARDMWSPDNSVKKYGKGFVYPDGYSLEELLLEHGVLADMKTENSDPVLFIHRKINDGDVYFVSNQSEQNIKISPTFRVKGKQPELWNPLTAEIRYLPEYKCYENGTQVPLQLEPLESIFVVFKDEIKSVDAIEKSNFPVYSATALSGPWNLKFEDGRGAPEEEMKLDTLIDWSKSDNDGIRYYSGTATYTTSFEMDSLTDKYFYIDLGKVMVMAKVWLNDQYVGGVWTCPYRLPITGMLKEGKNTLKVEVVNNWMNRLIGDLSLPEDKRFGKTFVMPWTKESPLQSSGLLGPVQIMSCFDRELSFLK